MFAAFRMFFATLASLFSATEKLANAANHAASFVEGESAHFANKANLARVQDIKRINAAFSVEDLEIAANERARIKELDAQVIPAAKAK